MKKLILLSFMALFLFGTPFGVFSEEPVRIEVLYLNHGPLRPTLRELDKLFTGYGDRIAVYRYDFETEEGEQFKTEKGIKRHVPLVLWIDGQSTLKVNGTPVQFRGFPTGSGPAFFQGKWNMDVLKEALDQITNKN
jgi:hypothetical protein